jgi:ABC-type amino acid transport substrate-binding protein
MDRPGAVVDPLHPDLSAFGEYERLELPEAGGMGVVYRAYHRRLKRVEAVKVIRAGHLAGPQELARFRSEAEKMAALAHPNIVPVYYAGEVDGQPYLAMKWVDGGNLRKRMDQSRGSFREAARLLALVARAVQYAHERGIVHRDLKPGNILLDEQGQPYVADFGLAKCLAPAPGTAGAEPQTQSGAIPGTPRYMAPEQTVAGMELTAAVDTWALGVILYELLTGRPPFRGAGPLETLELVRSRDPEPPRRLNPAVPRDLETVCLKCLEKEPARRYASAADLADDLELWLRPGGRIRNRPPGRPERCWRWVRRRPIAAVLAALAAVLLVAAVVCLAALPDRSGPVKQGPDIPAPDSGHAALPDRSWEDVQQAGTLRVATDPTYPPLEYYDEKGHRVGFDIELAGELGRRLDPPVDIKFVEVPWDWPAIVKRLNAGDFDVVISGVQITAGRKKQVAFLQYLSPSHYFVSRPGAKFNKAEDLAGKIVAVPKGTGTEELVKGLEPLVGIAEVKSVDGNSAPFELVREGKADVTLAHEPAARYFAKRDLVVTGPINHPLDPDSIGIAFRRQDLGLQAKVEEALQTMRDKRSFPELKKWVPPPPPP